MEGFPLLKRISKKKGKIEKLKIGKIIKPESAQFRNQKGFQSCWEQREKELLSAGEDDPASAAQHALGFRLLLQEPGT